MISLEFGLCLTPLSLLESDSEPCREREGEREREREGEGEGEGGRGGEGGRLHTTHTFYTHTHIHIFYTHYTHTSQNQVCFNLALLCTYVQHIVRHLHVCMYVQ